MAGLQDNGAIEQVSAGNLTWRTVAGADADAVDGTTAADTIRLVRNAFNPSILDVFFNNAGATPTQSVALSTLERIAISGLGGDDTVTIDSANGVIVMPRGIRYDAGANGGSLVLTGQGVWDLLQGPAANGDGRIEINGNDGVQRIDFLGLSPTGL